MLKSKIRASVGKKLVFDIGLHRGDDSAYYLYLGYQVLGIEANPLLAAACSHRFERDIQEGRMRVLNVGAWKEPGIFTFYRNLHDDGWSSFVPERGKRGDRWEELVVPCTTIAHLIANYGKPFFMKVDIEGTDIHTLSTLTQKTAPQYISLELNASDPIIERLVELGYSAFKFVNGKTFRPSPPIFEHEIGWRLLRKTGQLVPFVRGMMSRLPERIRVKSEFDPPGTYNPDGYPFGAFSSGPFGEQAAGSWLSPDSAIRWFRHLTSKYRRDGKMHDLWWDVHARHSFERPMRPDPRETNHGGL